MKESYKSVLTKTIHCVMMEWLSTEQEMKEKETWQIIYWQVTKWRA